MELKGWNGNIELHNDKIIIKRKGLIAKLDHGFSKGDKTIYLNQITGIELKTAGLKRGYMQFTLPGGIEHTKGGVGKGTSQDENTVEFFHAENNTAKKLKVEIEKRKVNYSQPIASKEDGAEAIRKYKQLADDGIITQKEFEVKKKEILGL
jgi:hypothetical protein